MNNQETSDRFDKALIASRLEDARVEIRKISNGANIKLLAVTKTVPVDVINYTIDELGVTAIGENRVQELLSKYDELHAPKDQKLEIHLIGSLQTNKVKYIIDKVDMIESVDSVRLAAEIDRQAKKHGITMDILIEINIGREEQKGGILPDELDSFINELEQFGNLRLRGLMTIAPKCENSSDYSKYFDETNKIFNSTKANLSDKASDFDVLSMGMSGSYREAIASGSTQVRLGSTIFGSRPYPETKQNDNN